MAEDEKARDQVRMGVPQTVDEKDRIWGAVLLSAAIVWAWTPLLVVGGVWGIAFAAVPGWPGSRWAPPPCSSTWVVVYAVAA